MARGTHSETSIQPEGYPTDTFHIDAVSVDLGQDAWINPVQIDSSRNGQRPAILLDLLPGDDSGTPQATDRSEDIYFAIERYPTKPGSSAPMET
ncbi:MAG TPA: hypothetical protein VGI81_26075 [Tepidisphaeraceae bacterium]|jgi:hypothetical protein